MVFSKSFPKGQPAVWEEVFLTEEEEKEQEKKCRIENIRLMQECIEDAKGIVKRKELKEGEIVKIASILFDKRASHVVYWKENKAKEKFEKTI